MPNKKTTIATATPTKHDQLIEQLQKNIDLSVENIVNRIEKNAQHLNAIESKMAAQDQRVIKLNEKIDALDDCVKESFDQFNKKLTEHAVKITVLENFKNTYDMAVTNKQKLLIHSRLAIWLFLAVFIAGAAIERGIIQPLFNYLFS